jgi:hypothetical protein
MQTLLAQVHGMRGCGFTSEGLGMCAILSTAMLSFQLHTFTDRPTDSLTHLLTDALTHTLTDALTPCYALRPRMHTRTDVDDECFNNHQ